MDFSDTRGKTAAMQLVSGQGFRRFPQKKESMTIYTCFIQHVINSLKKNGKGAIVIPADFVTAKSGVEIFLIFPSSCFENRLYKHDEADYGNYNSN